MPKGHIKESSETNVTIGSNSGSKVKDVSNVLDILDSPHVLTNPFGANISGENSYRRAERISAALHLVTNHVPDMEPLRVTVRESGLRLLERILELRSGFRSAASEKGQSALADIRSLISHVRLLAVAGYVSAPNAHSLVEALDELGNLIVISQRSTLGEQVSLSRDDLMPRAQFSYRTSEKRPIQRTTPSEPVERPKKDNKGIANTIGEHSDRGGRILDILRVGGELGIKDVASNLPQYSEKMIQRELADLAEKGLVVKVGEKRWSRYRITAS
jgi:hypothetical protein